MFLLQRISKAQPPKLMDKHGLFEDDIDMLPLIHFASVMWNAAQKVLNIKMDCKTN